MNCEHNGMWKDDRSFVEQHLDKWLERERITGEKAKIVAFLEVHPQVLDRGDSWSDIHKLAERFNKG